MEDSRSLARAGVDTRGGSDHGRLLLVGGLVLAAALATGDVIAGQSVILIGLLSAAPLLTGLRNGAVPTAVVGAVSIAVALALLPANDFGDAWDAIVRVLVVVIGAVVGVRMGVLRDRASKASADAQAVLHSVFESALDCIVSMDQDGKVIDLNPAAERVFGYDREHMRGKQLSDLIVPPELRDAHREGLARLRAGGDPRILNKRVELPALRADGSRFPVELTVTLASSDPRLYTGFIRDITDRRRAEDERARRERDYAFLARAGTLLENSLDFQTTVEQVIRLAVPEIADWGFVELIQEDGSIKRVAMAHSDPAKEELVREFDKRYPIDPDAPEGSAKVIRTGEPELIKDLPDEMLEAVAQDDEHLRFMRGLGFRSAMVVPLRARGHLLGDLALAAAESGRRYDEEDLRVVQELATHFALAIDNARLYADARWREEELRRHAYHDSLTGLPNRTLFLDRLMHALARAGRREGEPALLFFDLDGFKAVNDRYGHETGDELLRSIPDRIRSVLRPADTVGRFGGDEFAILCEDVGSPSDATVIAERLIEVLGRPYQLSEGVIEIGTSIGIAFATADTRPETMIRDADAAMYQAKRNGGNRFSVFARAL